jgi:hypothetical protein
VEPTLSEARRSGEKLPRLWLTRMEPERFSAMSLQDRFDWYLQKLGDYEDQLEESSAEHLVPKRLLAAVILNELADIDWRDAGQQAFKVLSGSLGIAQIQIDTVMRDQLFPDLSEEELRHGAQEWRDIVGFRGLFYDEAGEREGAQRVAIRERLLIPQHSIHAAGREIRLLLYRAAIFRERAWQRFFGFRWPGGRTLDPDSLYDEIDGRVYCESPEEIAQREKEGGDFVRDVRGTEGADPRREREKNLAYLIAAAYNDPTIISAESIGAREYLNSRIHGNNCCRIASDLYDLELFGT